MDSVVAQLLARLSMFLTQELDLRVDAQRFAEEPEYAAQVLGLVDEMGDHEFRTIAGEIRKRQLDLFSLKNTSAPRETDSGSQPPGEDETQLLPGKRV